MSQPGRTGPHAAGGDDPHRPADPAGQQERPAAEPPPAADPAGGGEPPAEPGAGFEPGDDYVPV